MRSRPRHETPRTRGGGLRRARVGGLRASGYRETQAGLRRPGVGMGVHARPPPRGQDRRTISRRGGSSPDRARERDPATRGRVGDRSGCRKPVQREERSRPAGARLARRGARPLHAPLRGARPLDDEPARRFFSGQGSRARPGDPGPGRGRNVRVWVNSADGWVQHGGCGRRRNVRPASPGCSTGPSAGKPALDLGLPRPVVLPTMRRPRTSPPAPRQPFHPAGCAPPSAARFLYVFELNLERGPDPALGQVARYMGWIKGNMAAAARCSAWWWRGRSTRSSASAPGWCPVSRSSIRSGVQGA